MCEPAVLRVIVDQNSIRKLHLPSGIPDTCDKLESVVREKFQIKGSFTLHYKDTDFDEFFSLISTSELKDKDTIKVVQTEPVIINLTTIDSLECAGPSATDAQVPSDDCSLASSAPSAFGSSDDTVLLSFPDSHGQRSKPWPSPFEIPEFAYDTELVLKFANDAYKNDGTALNNPSVKSDILEKLAEKIFQFCAYPTSQQISSVAEALIQKHPCLKEPGSFSGFYGWQTRLKYKMGNYRSKLRSLGCPEVAVNSAKNKRPAAVKKPKKAEINYLPPHPSGVTIQSLEQERVELLDEVKIRDNWRNINQKMARTFSYRRQEIIEKSPSIASILERWPALFDTSQVKEEFRRLTAVELETTFMGNLDKHTDALLSLFCTKGGHAGQQISEILNMLNQTSPVEQRREVVIRCLIVYLSENPENLIKHHQDTHGNKEELEPLTLKIITKGGSTDDPLQTGIVLEGIEVMTGLAGVAKACVYLLGLIYAINLSYPKELRYSFEFFQKILLELDSGKLSPKVYSLKNKLLC